MKKIIYLLLAMSNSAMAKDIKGSMKALEGGLKTDIGIPLATIGLIIVSFYFILGRKDASERFSGAIIGVGILLASGAIVAFMQTKVG